MPLMLLAALIVGVLIGMVGVGGVLLGPLLVGAGTMTANEATATSTWAFLFTGVIGTLVYSVRGLVSWHMVGSLAIGVVPGAFFGALVNSMLPPTVILLVLAVLTISVGLHQFFPRHLGQAGRAPGRVLLVGVGLAVGFGSALTGTGGPVLLVPALLMLRVAPLEAVAVSQAAQLPVVLSGSVVYIGAGLTDVRLGSLLGLVAASGVVAGALAATRCHPEVLRRVIAVACILAGLLLLASIHR